MSCLVKASSTELVCKVNAVGVCTLFSAWERVLCASSSIVCLIFCFIIGISCEQRIGSCARSEDKRLTHVPQLCPSECPVCLNITGLVVVYLFFLATATRATSTTVACTAWESTVGPTETCTEARGKMIGGADEVATSGPS